MYSKVLVFVNIKSIIKVLKIEGGGKKGYLIEGLRVVLGGTCAHGVLPFVTVSTVRF